VSNLCDLGLRIIEAIQFKGIFMKTLAINGSPKGKMGNTDFILQNFLIGMQNGGAKTETIYLNNLNISPCRGCLDCWFKTPGKCIIKDDMEYVLPKIPAADLIIYATPVYRYSMTGLLKNFLDRSLPLGSPFSLINQKIAESKLYPAKKENQKIFLIASAGLPGLKNFAPLVQTIKYPAGNNYLGEILCPMAGFIQDEFIKDKIANYSKNLQLAGKKLAEHEMINEELLKKLHEPWLSEQEFWKISNKYFQQILEK
jgi:multimeric flavodoxin WrbA